MNAAPRDVEPGDLRPDGEPADAPPGWGGDPLGRVTVYAAASGDSTTYAGEGGRLSRWQLLKTARAILRRRGHAQGRLRKHRTTWCQLRPATNAEGTEAAQIPVWRSDGRAWFGRVQVCGSPWACPVCAARVAQVRRRYLRELEQGAAARGWAIGLHTLTVPHGAGDDLGQLLEQLSQARRRMRSGRPWKRFRERWGWKGEARTLEVTHGGNGWHPHYHAMHFCEAPPRTAEAAAEFHRELHALWADACRRVGLGEPTLEHGVDVRWGSREGAQGVVADYISKWGFAGEVTGAQAKWQSKGGRTPWQLLAGASSSRRDAALWGAYADAFEGRRQLIVTPGLRDLLEPAQPDLDDFEAAQPEQEPEPDEQPEVVGYVTYQDWPAVCRAEAHEGALEGVLEAALRGPEALATEVARLRRQYPPPSVH